MTSNSFLILIGLGVLIIIAVVVVAGYSQQQADRELAAKYAQKQDYCSKYLPPTTALERGLQAGKRLIKEMQTGVAEPIITFEDCMKTYQP
jgi:hypothetical protein